MINNRLEAERAVAACRYPPEGIRSFGPIRAALYGGADYATEANTQIACIAMIETAEGLGNLQEIVATPGLDGIYIGPSDLALALDLTPRGTMTIPGMRRRCSAFSTPAKPKGWRRASTLPARNSPAAILSRAFTSSLWGRTTVSCCGRRRKIWRPRAPSSPRVAETRMASRIAYNPGMSSPHGKLNCRLQERAPLRRGAKGGRW